MTEQTTPEKKQKNNKALYWCLAIAAIGGFCLPDEVKIAVIGLAVTGIALVGLYNLNKLNKKVKPLQNEAVKVNKRYNREVGRATHYANASLEQGKRAIAAKKPEERKDAEHYEERFADEAKKTYVKLNPIPRKLTELIDRLPKRKH